MLRKKKLLKKQRGGEVQTDRRTDEQMQTEKYTQAEKKIKTKRKIQRNRHEKKVTLSNIWKTTETNHSHLSKCRENSVYNQSPSFKSVA